MVMVSIMAVGGQWWGCGHGDEDVATVDIMAVGRVVMGTWSWW